MVALFPWCHPSVIAYGPRSGSTAEIPVLRWFAGSDDRSNLTFDVYLDTNSSPTTLVANDTSNLSYVTSNLAMGTKYYWKVVATDPSGSKTSSVMNFTVKAIPEWSYDTDDDVLSVSVSDDGEYIAAGNTNYVYLFDKDSSTPLWKHDIGVRAYAVDMSSGGEYIAAGSDADKVYLFSKNSSTPIWTYDTDDNVRAVAISADGEYIVAGGSANKVYLFSKDSSTPLWSYSVSNPIDSVSISADGEYIVAGTQSSDMKVYLFDKDSSTPLWTYTAGDTVRDVSISADGEYIVSCSGDGKVSLFHRTSSTPLWTYTVDGSFASPSRSCELSANGEYIAVGNMEDDNRVYLFDKDSSTPLWYYSASDNIYTVSISKDGQYIIAGSSDDKIYFFGKDNNTPLWTYNAGGDLNSVSISADGKYIAAGSSDDNVYTFKNSLADRPSIIPYGPRSGSEPDEPVTLRWFAGSDDISNLTFDVYNAIVVSWLDPNDTNPGTNQHTLGAYGGAYPFFTQFGGTEPTAVTVSVIGHELTGLDFSADLSYATP